MSVNKQSDEQLMIMVREGKVEMLAILFERYHVKLYNFLLRLTGEKGTSEDLVQEVFCRILKYRSTYKGKSKFKFWVYQISRNVHFDYLRKDKGEFSIEEKWEEEKAPGPGPGEMLEQEQEHLILHKALSSVSFKKKEALVLSRFQNMKYKEIALLLGCSIESVKILVYRGIKELRKNFLELKGGSA